MASLYDTSAIKALNEDKYINTLYDSALDSQKKALQQGYDNSVQQLTTGQDRTAQKTTDYVQRANVEGTRAGQNVNGAANAYGVPQMIGGGRTGANAQARLTMGNQNQANLTQLQKQQSIADQEYERLRKLRGEQLATQIKQAQADNDMVRAQALYDAAKAEEEQLRNLRQDAAAMMASRGDYSIAQQIAAGEAVTPDTQGETWDGVLKNEDSINKIYDAQLESLKQQAQQTRDSAMSELEAQQQQAQRETDRNLTDAYVSALKNNQAYNEAHNAYGQSSGAAMRGRLANEAGLTGALTDLRALQLGKDAQAEQKKAALVHDLGQTIAKGQQDTDNKRAQALYNAAEGEEQNLIADQLAAGKMLAQNGDYSLLGALYGLTPEQMQALAQGGGGGGGGYSGGGYYKKKGDGDGTGAGNGWIDYTDKLAGALDKVGHGIADRGNGIVVNSFGNALQALAGTISPNYGLLKNENAQKQTAAQALAQSYARQDPRRTNNGGR